jgi:uncharacterized protein YbaP (TraB family)
MRFWSRRPLLCLLALALCLQTPFGFADSGEGRSTLWSLKGKQNTVYLLGSVHFLNPSERLPAAMLAAYHDAESLVMELDMDDIDQAEVMRAAQDLGYLPHGQTLASALGPQSYAIVEQKSREIGVDPQMLERMQPWFAALTLVQVQLMKLGLDPNSGVEQVLTKRAVADKKPISGLETVREQFEIFAGLGIEQQRDFLLYSVEDVERTAQEVERMIAAWRSGDTTNLDRLLADGMEKYPGVYRPLTVERNRRWIAQIERLLDDKDDHLVIVGALHLVGDESVIDLLEKKGHAIKQH